MSQKQPRVWTWLASELWRVRTTQAVAVAGVILHGALSVVDPLLIKWILDNGVEVLTVRTAVITIAAFVGVYSVRIGAMYVGSVAALRTQQQLSLQIPLRLYRRLFTFDDGFYHRHAVGDLTTRMERDVEQLATVCADLVPNLTRTVVATVSAVIVMFSMNWRLGACVVPFIGIFLVMRGRFRGTLERLADRVRQTGGARTSFLTESLIGMTDVQLLGAQERFGQAFRARTTDAHRAIWRQRTTEVGYSMAGLALFTVAVVTTLALGAWEIRRGRLTVGGYIAFYTLLSRLFDPLAAAAELYSRITRVGAGIRRIIELETYQPLVRDPDLVHGGTEAPAAGADQPFSVRPWRELVCRDVGFRYANGSHVLRGVDLVLRRGERVALLGRSGGGKSTTARLLVRLSDPSQGRVLLDGVDTKSIGLRELRQLVCVVPQDFHLFQGSLLYNATLGVGEVAADRLRQLARVASFDTVAGKFSSGWLHELGPGGSGLSEGEKQRLVLLRGLLRGSPILILDETTSALDPTTEADILERLGACCRDTCVLTITHRLSAALAADRIVIIHDGRIVRECLPSDLAEHPDVESLLWADTDDGYDPVAVRGKSMGER